LQYKLAEVYVEANNRAGLSKLIGDMEQSGFDRSRPEQWSRLVAQLGVMKGQDTEPAVAGMAGAGGAYGSSGTGQRSGNYTKRTPGDGIWLDAGDSLLPDDVGSHDLTLGTADLGLGEFDVGPETPQRERSPFSAPTTPSTTAVNFDLSLADLDSATEADFASLGLGSRADVPAASPFASTQELEQARGIDLDIDFDSEPPVELIQDTQVVNDDLSLGWEHPDSSPSRAGADPDSALGDSRFDTLSLQGADGANDLLGSEWELEAGLWDEVATKLELGRAYAEMNDREAAEAILLEVADEGTAAQQDEARALIARLKTG
jgi:pilus assembly protein FimV